jgi:hypothetical protein
MRLKDSIPESDLAQVPLFASLPGSELKRLAKSPEMIELEPDNLLVREGDPGDRNDIILEGQVELFKALVTTEERYTRLA